MAAQADVAVARTQLENTSPIRRPGLAAWAIRACHRRADGAGAVAVQPDARAVHAAAAADSGGAAVRAAGRRPDVAAAERRAAAANAEIGVAQAAWFPSLTLSADGGFRSGQFAELLTAPARFWSLGPALALTVFDGGARQAKVDQARGLRRAGGGLSTGRAHRSARSRGLSDPAARPGARAGGAGPRAGGGARIAALIRNQYEAGLVDYLSVSVVQATALNSERSALSLLGNRLAASVNLIVALGGGWDGLNPPPAQAATAPRTPPAAAAAEPAVVAAVDQDGLAGDPPAVRHQEADEGHHVLDVGQAGLGKRRQRGGGLVVNPPPRQAATAPANAGPRLPPPSRLRRRRRPSPDQPPAVYLVV